MKNLHDRWVKDCTAYRDLYDPVQDLELTPKIDWELLFQEKLVSFHSELLLPAALNVSADACCRLQSQLQSDYGPKVSDVEKQIAEHNILHKELEAYGDQLQPSSIPSKVKSQHSYVSALGNAMQLFTCSFSVHRRITPASRTNTLNYL